MAGMDGNFEDDDDDFERYFQPFLDTPSAQNTQKVFKQAQVLIMQEHYRPARNFQPELRPPEIKAAYHAKLKAFSRP